MRATFKHRTVQLSRLEVKRPHLYADASPCSMSLGLRGAGVRGGEFSFSIQHAHGARDELVSYRVFKASPEASLRGKWLQLAIPGCSQFSHAT